MANYKSYLKKDTKSDYGYIKLFIIAFFGMLLLFTFLIKAFSPKVDVSIGDYQQEEMETTANVDGRLAMIQEEDKSKNFKDIVKNADDADANAPKTLEFLPKLEPKTENVSEAVKLVAEDPVYKVYVGTYTSQEQARVAKDIIQDSGNGLNPIVKCLGSNNYTLQVGIFKNKSGADALLNVVQQNHLPARIVQEY